MNEGSLSVLGKQLTVFVANDKIWAFKWKLEFWETWICLYEFDSLPMCIDIFGEVHGDINEFLKIFIYWSVVAIQYCINSTLCNPMDCSPPGSSVPGDSPGKNIGVGCHAFLQGIFPTQESNPGLPHCMPILYCLSHQQSPLYELQVYNIVIHNF